MITHLAHTKSRDLSLMQIWPCFLVPPEYPIDCETLHDFNLDLLFHGSLLSRVSLVILTFDFLTMRNFEVAGKL